MSKYRHIFFDLDNTLTKSRCEMEPAHRDLFKKLTETKDVIVVSGATGEQMKKQLTHLFEGKYIKLSQYGNTAIDRTGSIIWQESLSEAQTKAILEFIAEIKKELNLVVTDENDLVHHKGSQVGYSLIGHNEDVAKKYAFDPGSVKRKEILARHKGGVEKLASLGIEVCPGGTTCLDFILAGYHKGFNVARLIKERRWKKEESLYIGDEIAPGRNDETVIGVIDTKAINNPDETFEFVASELLGLK